MTSVPSLTPGRTPVLAEGEYLVAEYSVRLVEGLHRGTLYVTPARVVFVDCKRPATRSRQAALVQTRTVEQRGADLLVVAAREPRHEMWGCEICSFVNDGAARVCATCGVARQAMSETPEIPLGDTVARARGECPQCTFLNNPLLQFCEMCGAQLRETAGDASGAGNASELRVRFDKRSTCADACQRVQQLRGDRAQTGELRPVAGGATAPAFGIQRLRSGTQSASARADELLRTSRQSVAEFQRNASELVALARRITASAHTSVVVGASSPAQIARQVADMLVGGSDVLAKHGGVLTLYDCFKMYNRSRGLGLVTPAQFNEALGLVDALRLPVRVRRLESGLRVVESRGHGVQIRQGLLHWITRDVNRGLDVPLHGVSARDVSEHFRFGVYIALEELQAAERDGVLCRDEHISGLKFFPNLIGNATARRSVLARDDGIA